MPLQQDKGDLDGALQQHQKALKIRESVLGVNHPNIATSYNSIGALLQDKGDFGWCPLALSKGS